MRDHLATLIDDFRRFDREIAVVRYQGNRRRVTTYGELARIWPAGLRRCLKSLLGIGAGDRVLLWAENSAEWIAAFYGCLLRGALAVPLDAAGSADFAARVVAETSPKLAVGDALLLESLALTPRKGIPMLAFEEWLDQLPDAEGRHLRAFARDAFADSLHLRHDRRAERRRHYAWQRAGQRRPH